MLIRANTACAEKSCTAAKAQRKSSRLVMVVTMRMRFPMMENTSSAPIHARNRAISTLTLPPKPRSTLRMLPMAVPAVGATRLR